MKGSSVEVVEASDPLHKAEKEEREQEQVEAEKRLEVVGKASRLEERGTEPVYRSQVGYTKLDWVSMCKVFEQ